MVLFQILAAILMSCMSQAALAQEGMPEKTFLSTNPAFGVMSGGPVKTESGAIASKGTLLSVPLSYARSGRLVAQVQTTDGRMRAGTLVHRFQFSNRSGQDRIEAWCGLGDRNPKKPAPVQESLCIVFTRDGRALFVWPNQPWDYESTERNILPTQFVGSSAPESDPSLVFDRPEIKPVPRVDSELSYVFVVNNLPPDAIMLGMRLQNPQGKFSRSFQPGLQMIPVKDGVGAVNFGQTRIVLRSDGQTVSVVSVDTLEPDLAPQEADKGIESRAPETASDIPESLRPRRFVIQGLQLHPDKFTPNPGKIASGEMIASGPATWWETGVLSGELRGNAESGTIDAPAGTRLYRVEFFEPGPLLTRTRSFAWCGGKMAKTVWGTRQDTAYCLTFPPEGLPAEAPIIVQATFGYDFAADMRDFLATVLLKSSGVKLIPDPSPVSPTFEVSIKLRAIKRNAIDLEFIANNGKNSQSILRFDFPRETGVNSLTLPLWTHSLELTIGPDERSVTAALIPGDVSKGPVDIRLEVGQQISPITGRKR
jgi:hypothetical protein